MAAGKRTVETGMEGIQIKGIGVEGADRGKERITGIGIALIVAAEIVVHARRARNFFTSSTGWYDSFAARNPGSPRSCSRFV